MVGLAYAAVPLYTLFCKTTGFGGTPIASASPAAKILDQQVVIRFDGNVMPGLAMEFHPEVSQVTARLGQTITVLYTLKNVGADVETSVATFNVQPDIAGAYFNKLQCFCYTDQTVKAGESREVAVVFYVDPALVSDHDAKGVKEITLSYSLFPSKKGNPVAAAASALKL